MPLTFIKGEGFSNGFDPDLVRLVADADTVPIFANGRAGSLPGLGETVVKGGGSAVALRSTAVSQKRDMGVLVNFAKAVALQGVLR